MLTPMKVFPSPEKLQFARRHCSFSGLGKNIAKNFMDHFFKGEGCAIMRR